MFIIFKYKYDWFNLKKGNINGWIVNIICLLHIYQGFWGFGVNSIWFEISFGSIGTIDFTPVVFWIVTAVIAVIAYEPKAVIVLISAWIPAPPDESDPAIINILDFGFNLFNFSWYYI